MLDVFAYMISVHNALASRIRALRAQIGGAPGAGGGDAAARWCAACGAPKAARAQAAGFSARHEARAAATSVELAITARCASFVRLRPHEGQRPPRQRHLLQV